MNPGGTGAVYRGQQRPPPSAYLGEAANEVGVLDAVKTRRSDQLAWLWLGGREIGDFVFLKQGANQRTV